MSAFLAILFTILIYIFFAYVEKKQVRWLGGSLMFLGLIVSIFLMMFHF